MTPERGQPSRRVRVSPWRRSTGLGLRNESFLRWRSTSTTPDRPAVIRTLLTWASITRRVPATGKLLCAWLLVSERNPTHTRRPNATSTSANRPRNRRRPRRDDLVAPAVVLPAIAWLPVVGSMWRSCQHGHRRASPAARPSGYPAFTGRGSPTSLEPYAGTVDGRAPRCDQLRYARW